jgi:hypothetical protein
MHPSRMRVFVVTLVTAAAAFAVFAGTAAARPIIGNITGTANTSWTNVGGCCADQVYNATVGLWTGGFGSEPFGDDVLTVPIKINGNGGITFDYQIQTTDVLPYDYLNVYLDTPSGTQTLVSNYNPNPSLFSYFLSPVNTVTVDTSQWKGPNVTVTLRIVAHQDGYGDQFQALITNLRTLSKNDV